MIDFFREIGNVFSHNTMTSKRVCDLILRMSRWKWLSNLLKTLEIGHEVISAYSFESNSMAERLNWLLMIMAKINNTSTV